MTAPPAEVRVHRGTAVESRHRVSIAVVDAAGRPVFTRGDPEAIVFLRSAAKPFQAAAALASGALDPLGVTGEELATIAASHSGEAGHVAAVTALLGRMGLDDRALRCGAHPPLHAGAAARLGTGPGPVHNNCSGKHAGMLALALRLGEEAGAYLDPGSATQRRILEVVAAVCGTDPGGVLRATDGCSAPTFAVPLRAAARAFALLARPQDAPADLRGALERIAGAMNAHPWWVAGTGRFDTDLMRAGGVRLVSKAGAEAVQGIADRETGLGLFLKVEDGGGRAAAPAAMAVLRALGWLSPDAAGGLAPHAAPVLTNHAGLPVGHIEAFVPPGD